VCRRFGSDAQLVEIAALVVSSMAAAAVETGGISIGSITARLLRRAEFYEMRWIQGESSGSAVLTQSCWLTRKLPHPGHLQTALLAQVTIPSLSPLSDVLAALSASKPPKALRALDSTVLVAAVSVFDRVSALLPMEYVGKNLRNELIQRAVGLDLWISAGKLDMTEEELAGRQRVLRRFVLLAAATQGASLVRFYC
jgi:hypothetical protein